MVKLSMDVLELLRERGIVSNRRRAGRGKATVQGYYGNAVSGSHLLAEGVPALAVAGGGGAAAAAAAATSHIL